MKWIKYVTFTKQGYAWDFILKCNINFNKKSH